MASFFTKYVDLLLLVSSLLFIFLISPFPGSSPRDKIINAQINELLLLSNNAATNSSYPAQLYPHHSSNLISSSKSFGKGGDFQLQGRTFNSILYTMESLLQFSSDWMVSHRELTDSELKLNLT